MGEMRRWEEEGRNGEGLTDAVALAGGWLAAGSHENGGTRVAPSPAARAGRRRCTGGVGATVRWASDVQPALALQLLHQRRYIGEMQQPDKRNALLHHHTDAPSPSDGKCDPDEAAPLHQGLPQQCGLDGTTPIHQGLAPWCGHDITAPLHRRLQPEILEQVCRFIGTNVQKEDAQ
ncbi:uncharacterized protein LOC125534328 [Triticum urartu]|uniref:uncharacterized protein n=1 Tax=Triticum aestivum TaxID=4565 RepID=UPI001D02576B|nr:uncharacterized protein LOC123127218 [Triticum aestivum]XP_044423831.1 uncharacterized protein LOC123148460 [Triticum aestivum]XP_048553537.1 uncharacterized protein LOC125534328 [Triticum urartu]